MGAWLVLAAMNANVFTERANSAGRLVINHLRAGLWPNDAEKLVLSLYAHRAARKHKLLHAKLRVHPDILALQPGGPALPPPGGATAGVAPVVIIDDGDTPAQADDLALPQDEIDDDRIDADLRLN